MRVLLVGPDLEENLSLRYLSSSLRAAGHAPRSPRSTPQPSAVLAAAPRQTSSVCRCATRFAPRSFSALAPGAEGGRPESPVVAGGHYASCAAQELLARHPELDLVVIHEGERTLVELAGLAEMTPEALSGVRGIVFRGEERIVSTPPREILADLDALPWPDRSGPARLLAGVPTAYMMGSRGCLGACDYCCISTLHRLVPGRRFRQRRPEMIAEEMAWLYHERGVRQFVFHDDNFLVPSVERNLERIDALERALRRRGVRHVGLALKCRPADVDREVFLRLRAMGLLRVFLGHRIGQPGGARVHRAPADGERAASSPRDLRGARHLHPVHHHPLPSGGHARDDARGPRLRAATPRASAQLLSRGDLRGHAPRAAHDRRRTRLGRLSGADLPLHRSR